MKPRARHAVGWMVALGATLGLAGLSRLPYDGGAAELRRIASASIPSAESVEETSVIRLSWRAAGERVDECRRPSAEELERTPVHMRREEICEGRILPYHLRLEVDEQVVLDETIRPAGLREDRPLYVFREIRLPPGRYDVEVSWRLESRPGREADGTDPGRAPGEAGTGRGRGGPDRGEAMGGRGPLGDGSRGGRMSGPGGRLAGRSLEFSDELELRPREVALITYDLDERRLVARRRARAGEVSQFGRGVGPYPAEDEEIDDDIEDQDVPARGVRDTNGEVTR